MPSEIKLVIFQGGFGLKVGFYGKRFISHCLKDLEKYTILTFYALNLLHKPEISK